VKTDPNGKEEWNRTFEGSYFKGNANDISQALSVQQSSDGGYILSGNVMRQEIHGDNPYGPYWFYPGFSRPMKTVKKNGYSMVFLELRLLYNKLQMAVI